MYPEASITSATFSPSLVTPQPPCTAHEYPLPSAVVCTADTVRICPRSPRSSSFHERYLLQVLVVHWVQLLFLCLVSTCEAMGARVLHELVSSLFFSILSHVFLRDILSTSRTTPRTKFLIVLPLSLLAGFSLWPCQSLLVVIKRNCR